MRACAEGGDESWRAVLRDPEPRQRDVHQSEKERADVQGVSAAAASKSLPASDSAPSRVARAAEARAADPDSRLSCERRQLVCAVEEPLRGHRTEHDDCGGELLTEESVWQELEALGATVATVALSVRAGRGGRTERIVLSQIDRDELVDVERWIGRDELCYALEAPIWDRFGSFAGQPLIAGTVIWTAADRRVIIEGRQREKRFDELV